MSKVVLVIIVANVLFSIKGFSDQVFFNKNKFQVGAVKNGEYWRIFTSAFLHVDQTHLIFNMLTLYFFADNVLKVVGIPNFAMIYIGSLVAGNLLAYNYHKNNLYYSAVGASGAVMGVVYSAILSLPGLLIYGLPSVIFGLGYLLYSIYGMKKSVGNIGHSAHIGGAIGGYLLTIILHPSVIENNMKMVIILAVPILLLFIFEKRLKQ